MARTCDHQSTPAAEALPSLDRIQQELATAVSIDDFFGKEGIVARLFAGTLEPMLEADLTAQLGSQPPAASGRTSGTSRNGKRPRSLRTSAGDMQIQVPRDRTSEVQPGLLETYQTSTTDLEETIIALDAKGVSTRDSQEPLQELDGGEVSAQTISTIPDKVWSVVEAWQPRPLAAVSPIVSLDCSHLKLRRDGRLLTPAVSIVLGVDVDGRRDGLGQWVGDGGEGANFWLSVVTELQSRGVEDIVIACIDGLTGFKEAIHAVVPQTQLQRCIIHQVRQSLTDVSWPDRKAVGADRRQVVQAPPREAGEERLVDLGERWGETYAVAVRSWDRTWEDRATMVDSPAASRRLISTTTTVEGSTRQLRKVVKTNGALPSADAARKVLYLVTAGITKKWTAPMFTWATIRNQLALRVEGRVPV